MLKTVLLATSMCIAVPAFAQEAAPTDTQQQDRKPVSEATPAAPEAPPAAEAPVATDASPTAEAAPVAEAAPAPTAAPVEAVAAAPAPAPAAPATSQDQVAQVVTSEFGSYDKNADGALDQTEFTTWMVALRKASDPAFAAESTEGKAWLAAAFTQADADKNAGVNATELTSFLTPKPAA